MSAVHAHGGITSPGWEQMRLNKAKEAQDEAEKNVQMPPKKIRQNRIIAAVLIVLFLAVCAYFIFFAPIAPVNMG